MIFISLLIIIVAIALPSINKHISPVLFTRISSIVFIYAASLLFNIEVYIQSIGSGIGIYSNIFHITVVSQLMETSISHRFSYKNLEFKLKIKNVTPTNKLDEKGQIIIQHEVKFDINKISHPIDYRKYGKNDIEKVLKHTAKTKFVIKRVSLDENLIYKPMLSDYYTCVKPKNKANDYLENPVIWLYMLELANKNLLKNLLKQEHVIKADNSAGPSDHNRLNNKNKKIKINNLFKGARSFSTSSLNFNNKSYASQVYLSYIKKFRSLKRNIETYITDNENIEKINFEYENYYINLVKFKFLLKSKNLKNKIKNEKGILSITNKDLEIFRLKSESTDHIVLSHIDMDNCYMIEVSISKFNPDLFGNYIFYNLMYYEREPGFKTDFYFSKSIRWADEITVDEIYKEYSPLKLKLQSHYLDYTRDFNNIDLNLLLIHPSLIKTKYIRSFSTIYNDIYKDNSNLETIINNNDCRKMICKVLMQVYKIKHSLSLQNRFIIKNELFEIDPVFINNLIKKDNREINFVNLLPKSIKKQNCKQDINNDMNLTMHSKDKIIQMKRLFIFKIKKKTKVNHIAIFDFNKDNKTLNFKTVLENKKDKYKNILFNDKLYNIPDFFFSNHFKENFDSKINQNKTDKDKIFKNYLNNNQVNLISTFCFVYNLDQTFKNKLYLLHFNHITGKIDFYLDYYSFKLIKLEKTSHKNYNSLKLFNLILANLRNNHKNIFEFKIKDLCASKYVVQLSSTVLNNIYNNGEVNNTFNSSKLFFLSKSYLKDLTDNSNVTISVIDFNDKFLPLFLKDFLIIYRNKKNSKIKIEDIILNFNKLVESRDRKIKKNFFL
uniref:hypothetical protein n=1 Tax=Pappia fissilis TaxID=1040649 RepID=UPI002A7F5B06|nr:hypothetical protein UYP79_mgp062 [Pappia fissilis]WOX61274.1 hypothetical protein [Pappia fissilis]